MPWPGAGEVLADLHWRRQRSGDPGAARVVVVAVGLRDPVHAFVVRRLAAADRVGGAVRTVCTLVLNGRASGTSTAVAWMARRDAANLRPPLGRQA
jgi:arginine/ornithine N-succinyltransferase beta subunit